MPVTDLRRYPRIATRQPVTVRAAGVALGGEIRDYCREGVYVAFDRPVPPEAVGALAPAGRVRLDFSRAVGERVRDFSVDARIARSLPLGLGLQVDALATDVLQALGAASASAAAPALADPAASLDADARRAIRDRCTVLFDGFLKAVLRDFLEAVTRDLSQAAELAVDGSLRFAYGDAVREIAFRHAAVRERFVWSVRDAIRRLSGAHVETPAGDDALRLTAAGDDPFEDWLNLATVAQRVEAEQPGVLADLHRRYGALRRIAIDASNCPFGPEAVCRALQDAMLALETTSAARAIAYRTFRGVLSRHGATFYRRLNAVLAPLDGPVRPARDAAPAPRAARRAGRPHDQRPHDRRPHDPATLDEVPEAA